MENLRKYGNAPFNVAVLHGGPGALGEMAPVARELASTRGILEPLQAATSLDGQVRELHAVLKENGDLPATLIGYSWGAMLAFIFAARHPLFAEKIILVGSGVYEEKYAENIMKTRLGRLGGKERTEALTLMENLQGPANEDKNAAFTRLGELITRADSYDPLQHYSDVFEFDYQVYQGVWSDAEKLRRGGKLLKLGKKIQCPVVAIHGDNDPHPAEGIKNPLSRVLKDFRFILLEKCGHCPWYERNAKDNFFGILIKELE